MLQVLKGDDGSTVGDEIILLTDGEATDPDLNDCKAAVENSRARVHTIALGAAADKTLQDFATITSKTRPWCQLFMQSDPPMFYDQ